MEIAHEEESQIYDIDFEQKFVLLNNLQVLKEHEILDKSNNFIIRFNLNFVNFT